MVMEKINCIEKLFRGISSAFAIRAWVSCLCLVFSFSINAQTQWGSVGPATITELTVNVDGTVTINMSEDFTACTAQGDEISFVYDEATNSVNYLMALSTAYSADMEIYIDYKYENSVCEMIRLYFGSST